MGENYITVVNPHFQDSTPSKRKRRSIPKATDRDGIESK